jgi:hypothetical protein
MGQLVPRTLHLVSDRGAAAGRLEGRSQVKETTKDRRSAYLAQAYACQDMALQAEDAGDRCALRAMTLIWEALAERAKEL